MIFAPRPDKAPASAANWTAWALRLSEKHLARLRLSRAARHRLGGDLVPEISLDTVALVAGLRKLPDRQRVVLVLHYLADMPVNQIALELQCPVGSVKAWLSRGRDALAAAMGDAGGGGAHLSSPVRISGGLRGVVPPNGEASSEVADA